MMFPFTRRHIRPIGLEIGPQRIHLIQLATVRGQPAVVAAGWRPLPFVTDRTAIADSAAIVKLIKQILAEEPFVGRRATATLSDEAVHFRTVRVPNLPADQISAAALREAAGLFKFNLNGALVRTIRAGQIRRGSELFEEVIVAAVQQNDCEHLLDILHDSGLRPDSLQLRPLAVYRAAARIAPADPVLAIIEVGHHRTSVIIGTGSNITFLRTIEIGGWQFEQAIARKLGLDADQAAQLRSRMQNNALSLGAANRRDSVASAVFDATRALLEELAGQVSRCFRYHAISFRGPLPTRAILAGTEQADPHLRSALAAAISVPIESLDLFHGIDTSAVRASDGESLAERWTVALGVELPAPIDLSPSLIPTAIQSQSIAA